MIRSSGMMLTKLQGRPAGSDARVRAASKRHHGAALRVAALVGAAVLGGCAGQAGSASTTAGYGQDAPYHVAGPAVPAPKASRAGGQACYGNSAGLVDECGSFARYNGLF